MKRQPIFLVLLVVGLLCSTTHNVWALDLYSQGAVAINGADGTVLYEKNGDAPRPPASTAKLMTVFLLFERIETGAVSLEDTVTISPHAAAVAATSYYSNVSLKKGGSYTISDLLTAIAVHSACGATVAIAEYLDGSESAFVTRMNRRAAELGMKATFYDCTGLSPNDRVTARSLGLLAYELVSRYPEYLQFSSQHSFRWGGITYHTTNLLLSGERYEYAGADGLKTGTSTPAGACLVSTAQRDGARVIAVTLGCQSAYQRFTDSAKLLDYGFEQILQYPLGYRDVPISAWFFEGVRVCSEAGLMVGLTDTSFAPKATVSRAMFVTVLQRLDGGVAENPAVSFPDVAPGRYYTEAVQWAFDNEIVMGFEDGCFRPDEPVTREQMMTMLYAYARSLDPTVTADLSCLDALSDNALVSAWAREGAAWSVQSGLITGMADGTLAPQDTATRAQLATVFARQL